jgi:hypothetical protein
MTRAEAIKAIEKILVLRVPPGEPSLSDLAAQILGALAPALQLKPQLAEMSASVIRVKTTSMM